MVEQIILDALRKHADLPDLEFIVQELTLDLPDFQKAQENVQ